MAIDYLIATFIESLKGVPTTLFITFFALIAALPLGLLFAIARLKKLPGLSRWARLYTSVVRGPPQIL